jgi:hypothetical protein
MLRLYNGLSILLKYDPNGECSIDRNDECIYCGPNHNNLSLEDLKTLEELNWFWEETYECWGKFL